MRLAEVVLRVGASLGAWMIFIGFALTLAALPHADCDPASDTLWRGTLAFGLSSALGLAFAGSGLPWRRSLRWVAALAIALAVLALLAIAPALLHTLVWGDALCSSLSSTGATAAVRAGASAGTLERIWTPVQACVLTAGIWQGLRYWLRAPGMAHGPGASDVSDVD